MYKLRGILTTTHVDRHGHQMTRESLEGGARQMSARYIPFGVEHDPRIPPIGRVVGAQIKLLEDGEFGLEGEIEVFEPEDELPLSEDGRDIPLRSYPETRLQVVYDMALEDAESSVIIADLSKSLGTDPSQEMKKAFEPISVLVIGGAAFVLGQLAQGFFTRLGEDGYEVLKAKIRKLIERRHSVGKDTLLDIALVVPIDGYEVEVSVLCKNPSDADVQDIVERQLGRIDNALPALLDSRLGIRRLVFEYEEGDVHLRFAVRRDAVPLFRSSMMQRTEKVTYNISLQRTRGRVTHFAKRKMRATTARR